MINAAVMSDNEISSFHQLEQFGRESQFSEFESSADDDGNWNCTLLYSRVSTDQLMPRSHLHVKARPVTAMHFSTLFANFILSGTLSVYQ